MSKKEVINEIIMNSERLLKYINEDLIRWKNDQLLEQKQSISRARNTAILKAKRKEIRKCIKRIAEIDKQLLLLERIKDASLAIDVSKLKSNLLEKREKIKFIKHRIEHT